MSKKDKKDKKENKHGGRETLFGQRVIKSGSTRATTPSPKPKNDMRLDYKKLRPKQFSQAAKINIDFGEERFPPEAKVPNKQKYDSKGRYIKHMNLVEKEQAKTDPTPSMNTIMKESALSNPKRGNGKKGRKKN